MTRSHGRLAELYIDNAAGACQVVSGDLSTITFNDSKATPESATLGDSTIQRETDGIRDGALDMAALYSAGTGACVSDLLEGMYSGSDHRRVQYFPEGRFAEKSSTTACMRLNNYSAPAPVDGISTISATLEAAINRVIHSNSYANKIKTTAPDNLLAYWPLWEFSGTTLDNYEGTALRDASASLATLGHGGIGDGKTSASFASAASSYVNLFTPSLCSVFSGPDGTLMLWAKVSASEVWADSTTRFLMNIHVDNNNRILMTKTATNNQVQSVYEAGGTPLSLNDTSITDDSFHMWAMSWSDDQGSDAMKVYVDGIQSGTTQTGTASWVGDITTLKTAIGSQDNVPADIWDGFIAHVAIWNTALTDAQIKDLASLT